MSRFVRFAYQRVSLLIAISITWFANSTPSCLAQNGSTISAANIKVIQNDGENLMTSVTVTAETLVRDFRIRSGSNAGDYTIQIGASATDDFSTGVTMTSVRQNGRDNNLLPNVGGNTGNSTANNIIYATSAIDADSNGLFIPVHGSGASNGEEFNVNVAAQHFAYADGWLGGHARNTTNGGAIAAAASSFAPGINLGVQFVESLPPPNGPGPNGQFTLNINTLTGNAASQNGILLVTGGKNEDNYSLSRANADGTFTIFNHDNGTDGGSYEQDGVAFVYVANSATNLVSGRIAGNGTKLASNNPSAFTVTPSVGAPGMIFLQIGGVTDPNAGVLMISAEGGGGLNVDNIVSYEWNPAIQGWVVQTRDLPNFGLQNLGSEAMFSFVYVAAVPEPSTVLLICAGGAWFGRRIRRASRTEGESAS